jgi:hypothetical protein
MEFAVYQHDIKHIILDNLQFMMPRKSGKTYDKFDSQDIAIEVQYLSLFYLSLQSSLSLSLASDGVAHITPRSLHFDSRFVSLPVTRWSVLWPPCLPSP